MRRIFLAINLPEKTKDEIIKKVWRKNLPGSFVSKENIHLTLVFLGYLKDKEICRAEKICADIVRHTSQFSLEIEKAILGPKNQMIWLVFKPKEALKTLQNRLKIALEEAKVGKSEKRPYWPHITLSRVKQKDRVCLAKIWQDINLNLTFSVKSIEVMESELGRLGAKHSVLKSFLLKEN